MKYRTDCKMYSERKLNKLECVEDGEHEQL